MNDWSTPMEADLAEACPVQWYPPTGGRVRMRNRETGEIRDGNSGGQYAVMGQPLKEKALETSLKGAWREADRVSRLQYEIVPDGGVPTAGQTWDTWVEPIGYHPMTHWAVSAREYQGPAPGQWMFPGVGTVMAVAFRDGEKIAGPDELRFGPCAGQKLKEAWQRALELSRDAKKLRGETVHVWIEAVLQWHKAPAKAVAGIGHPVPWDPNAPFHELGCPIDPLRAVEEHQNGGVTHPILHYKGIKMNLGELGL